MHKKQYYVLQDHAYPQWSKWNKNKVPVWGNTSCRQEAKQFFYYYNEFEFLFMTFWPKIKIECYLYCLIKQEAMGRIQERFFLNYSKNFTRHPFI